MDPKSVNQSEKKFYFKYDDERGCWFETEYSNYGFSRKEWDAVHRAFMKINNKNVHMPETDHNPPTPFFGDRPRPTSSERISPVVETI